VIVSLLTNETTDFSGEFYELKGALSEPKPSQKPHPPIVIGGTGRNRTLRAVARWAQMWDAMMVEPEEWLELREVLDGHCQDVGRDPDDIDCSTHLRYSRGDDVSKIADEAVKRFEVGVDVVIFDGKP
jgi:alkanesulfonate monooxygenase SsuD/methylene tetrahydromethanopterin reductase-like flavin-dependent oxidoreductase (luciferase family)